MDDWMVDETLVVAVLELEYFGLISSGYSSTHAQERQWSEGAILDKHGCDNSYQTLRQEAANVHMGSFRTSGGLGHYIEGSGRRQFMQARLKWVDI